MAEDDTPKRPRAPNPRVPSRRAPRARPAAPEPAFAADPGATAPKRRARLPGGKAPAAKPLAPPVRAAPTPAPHPERAEALRLLHEALERGRPLADASRDAAAQALPGPVRAHALRLATETIRRLGQADAVLARFVRRTPPAAARDALRLAAVSLHALSEAPHAAVDGAVAALRTRPGGARLTGLANAVARRLATPEAAALWARTEPDAPRLNAPGWLWGRLSSAHGAAAARRICAAHLAQPPLDLTPRDPADARALADALGATLTRTGSLRLSAPGQVSTLPSFAEGRWWVQDAAAALPARLLAPQPGERVLDLCAAPGGKTLQLAAAGADVTALDLSEPRLERLAENLARTGLAAETVCADALDWAPDAPFDAILLDAPCSATGTARRHPEVLHRREKPDLASLTALQDALLERAWSWLRPGGRLVFATCSLLPEEGEARAAAFRARTPAARPAPASGLPPELLSEDGDLRTRPDLWPELGGLDGFFAAAFVKEA